MLIDQEQMGQKLAPALLVLISDESYSIYLIHPPTITLFYKISHGLATKFNIKIAVLGINLLFLLIVASCFSVGTIVHLVVEKPLLAVLNKRRFPEQDFSTKQVSAVSEDVVNV